MAQPITKKRVPAQKPVARAKPSTIKSASKAIKPKQATKRELKVRYPSDDELNRALKDTLENTLPGLEYLAGH